MNKPTGRSAGDAVIADGGMIVDASCGPEADEAARGDSGNPTVSSDRLIWMALERAPSTGRNNMEAWLAMQARDNRYSQPETEAILLRYQSQVPDTNLHGDMEPYTAREALRTVRSIFTRPPRKPWSTLVGSEFDVVADSDAWNEFDPQLQQNAVSDNTLNPAEKEPTADSGNQEPEADVRAEPAPESGDTAERSIVGANDGQDDAATPRRAATSDTQATGRITAAANGRPESFTKIAPYPKPLEPEAYYGIAGQFVRLIEPHTEADPNFLLLSFLVYTGNSFGWNAYIWAGGDRHYPNLLLVGVGPTSNGRKGSATGPVEMFFEGIDEGWKANNIQSGLSSGEGLIWAVCDAIYKREKVKGKKGESDQYEVIPADPGIADKRLVVRESEFFGALQVMRRQGNTLSPVVRTAWDRGDLNSWSRTRPRRPPGPISASSRT